MEKPMSWGRSTLLLILAILFFVAVVYAAFEDPANANTGGTPYVQNNTGGMPYVVSTEESIVPASAAANAIVTDGFRNKSFRGVGYPASYVARVDQAEGYGICASLTAYVPKRGGGWRVAPRTRKARDCADERTGFTRLSVSNDIGRRYLAFLLRRFGAVKWVGKYHYLSASGTVEKGRLTASVRSS